MLLLVAIINFSSDISKLVIYYFIETFRPEIVLSLCEKYSITDARIYLLETMDRYKDAYNILAAILSDKVNIHARLSDPSNYEKLSSCPIALPSFDIIVSIIMESCYKKRCE